MALGSGDMRLGLDTLRQRMAEAKFPFLSANVVLSGTETLLTEPYIIKEMGDHRIAIIGLTEPGAADAVNGAVTVLNPIETARRYVAEVSSKATIIIVLSHIDVEENIKLAEEVEGCSWARPSRTRLQGLSSSRRKCPAPGTWGGR
jgi:2',3'-cyclic-nucleotide 2'-phosphodiesterase (5'-nucleotidase family)